MNVMAIGAHPDDIEFGCGGTLFKHKSDGDNIAMVVMTNTKSISGVTGESLRSEKELKNESGQSAKVLGCDLEFLPFTDLYVPFSFESVSKLEKAINNSLEKHRIYLPGFCDDAPTISASCDVFCLPSVKREGLPRAVIEAMAYGVPAIVTDSGGSPELVQNGKSGIVIPIRNAKAIADSIEKLYRDPEFKKSLGMNAKERIDVHFDNDETVKQTINVYRDLLSV